jgi:hypothetical protein
MGRKGKIREDIVSISEDDSPNAIKAVWSGTQVQYDALATVYSDTIYLIE